MRSKLYILAGVPGCGKSTWARNFFADRDIVSSDGIRAELYPGEYDLSRNAEVFDIFHQRIRYNLDLSAQTVADSTALTFEARARLREIANECNADVHVVMFTNTAQAGENNYKRDSRWIVPEAAWYRLLNQYQDAIYAVKDEGYESITYIEGVE